MSATGFRGCSRNGCPNPAVATLTYSYADQTAVLGPLSMHPDPHTYDLCAHHTERLTVPRGWDVVRLPLNPVDLSRQDDLLDLADALRAPRHSAAAPEAMPGTVAPGRPRLRVLPQSE